MLQNKSIVVIQTPTLFAKAFTQVTTLMTDEEFEAAKKERPDLIFKKLVEEPDCQLTAEDFKEEDVSKGVTVKGMVMPYDLEDQAKKILDGVEEKNKFLR